MLSVSLNITYPVHTLHALSYFVVVSFKVFVLKSMFREIKFKFEQEIKCTRNLDFKFNFIAVKLIK